MPLDLIEICAGKAHSFVILGTGEREGRQFFRRLIAGSAATAADDL